MKTKLICFSIVLLTGFFTFLISILPQPDKDYTTIKLGHSWEKYDTALFRELQSVDDILAAADARFAPEERTSLKYFEYIDELVSRRFYHDYSHYSFENPLAMAAGRLAWNHLSAIVIPDDIMKHPMAACSQQAVVLMECFKRRGIDYRKVGFAHHYTVEAKINGKWYFFDPNMEPEFDNRRTSYEELVATSRIDSIYAHTQEPLQAMDERLADQHYGAVNAPPAPNATIFHKMGFFLVSPTFMIALLAAFIFLLNTGRAGLKD